MRFALLLLVTAVACGKSGPTQPPSPQGLKPHAQDIPDSSIRSPAVAADAGSPHMRMTPSAAATRADQARMAQVLASARAAVAPYTDARIALAAGYEIVSPTPGSTIYHFVQWAAIDGATFDPAKPPALLYDRLRDGQYRLIGVMYTAPANATFATLDARIPLSIAEWHEHLNWCVPAPGQDARWDEHVDGRPVFGGESAIADDASCRAAGGRFMPHAYGWMTHLYL